MAAISVPSTAEKLVLAFAPTRQMLAPSWRVSAAGINLFDRNPRQCRTAAILFVRQRDDDDGIDPAERLGDRA